MPHHLDRSELVLLGGDDAAADDDGGNGAAAAATSVTLVVARLREDPAWVQVHDITRHHMTSHDITTQHSTAQHSTAQHIQNDIHSDVTLHYIALRSAAAARRPSTAGVGAGQREVERVGRVERASQMGHAEQRSGGVELAVLSAGDSAPKRETERVALIF